MKLVDGSGRVDQTYAFDEFGNDLIPSAKKIQPFGFTGYQKEEVGGLYYAQARRYNPFEGRFVSEDIVKGTIIVPFTLNHYNYCWNNPLQLVDLNGMWPEWAKKAGNWIVDHKEDIAKAVVAGTIVIAVVAVTAATFGTGAGVFVAAAAGAGAMYGGYQSEANGGRFIDGACRGASNGTISSMAMVYDAVGAMSGGATQLVTDIFSGQISSMETYTGAFIGGAIGNHMGNAFIGGAIATAGFVNSAKNGLNTRFPVYGRLVLHLAYTFCRA